MWSLCYGYYKTLSCLVPITLKSIWIAIYWHLNMNMQKNSRELTTKEFARTLASAWVFEMSPMWQILIRNMQHQWPIDQDIRDQTPALSLSETWLIIYLDTGKQNANEVIFNCNLWMLNNNIPIILHHLSNKNNL